MQHHVAAILLGACLTSAGALALAQSEKAPAGMDPAMMEQMMALMTPGEEHKVLQDMAGTWKTRLKMWMDPAAPPQESEGLCEYTSILGGRYVEGVYKGTMMGEAFEGRSIDGFDRNKKQYFSIWLDNMGTGYYLSHGSASADGKTLTHQGMMFEPMQNKDISIRSVTKVVDKNNVQLTMYSMDGEKEVKMMEIQYTRQ
jgi:hypothetical protein